jgi:hypothetical protein
MGMSGAGVAVSHEFTPAIPTYRSGDPTYAAHRNLCRKSQLRQQMQQNAKFRELNA